MQYKKPSAQAQVELFPDHYVWKHKVVSLMAYVAWGFNTQAQILRSQLFWRLPWIYRNLSYQ